MPDQPDDWAGDSLGPRLGHGAEIGRAEVKIFGYRLRRAVPGKKPIITDPAGRDESFAQPRRRVTNSSRKYPMWAIGPPRQVRPSLRKIRSASKAVRLSPRFLDYA
jgi:hypothetical protein